MRRLLAGLLVFSLPSAGWAGVSFTGPSGSALNAGAGAQAGAAQMTIAGQDLPALSGALDGQGLALPAPLAETVSLPSALASETAAPFATAGQADAGSGIVPAAHFQAELRTDSPFRGPSRRGEAADPKAIIRAVKQEGAEVYELSMASKEGYYEGTARLRVDPRLKAILGKLSLREGDLRAFFEGFYQESTLVHEDAFLTLGKSKKPVTLALLDSSSHLMENHPAQRLIGVNRGLFELPDPGLQKALFTTALAHELRQLIAPERGEDELTQDDAALFTHLLPEAWPKPRDFATKALEGLLAPASPFLALVEEAVAALQRKDLSGAHLRMQHKFLGGAATRKEREALREQAREFIAFAADERNEPNEELLWTQTDVETNRLRPLGSYLTALFMGRVLPAVMLASEAFWEKSVHFLEMLELTVDTLLSLSKTLGAGNNLAHAALYGLAPVLRLRTGLVHDPDSTPPSERMVPEAFRLLEDIYRLQAKKLPDGAREMFGLHAAAEGMLEKSPDRLVRFLYASKLFAGNGLDPELIERYLRPDRAGWRIPQTLRGMAKMTQGPDRAWTFLMDHDSDGIDVALFAGWVRSVTDRHFEFPVASTDERHTEALRRTLREERIPAEVVDESEGKLIVVVNPGAVSPAELDRRLAEPMQGETAPPLARTVESPAVLGKTIGYARQVWDANARKQYAAYEEPFPVFLTRMGGPLSVVEEDLRARQAAKKLSWESWKTSLQRLGDAALDTGRLADAKRLYREATWAPNSLEIAQRLARAGEDGEAMLHLDYLIAHLQEQLNRGLIAHNIHWQARQLQEALNALPGGRGAAYASRMGVIWRRLLLEALAEADESLGRTIRDFTESEVEPVPSPDEIGIGAFLDLVASHPMNSQRDWAPLGKAHEDELKGADALLRHMIELGPDELLPFILGSINGLWYSPVKSDLYRRFIARIDPERHNDLYRNALDHWRETIERYGARFEGGRFHTEAAMERGAALLAYAPFFNEGRRIIEALPAEAEVPDSLRAIYQSEIFKEYNGGVGLRTDRYDQRTARLQGLARLLRRQPAYYLPEALAQARAIIDDVAAMHPGDGLLLLRYAALREFIETAIDLEDFGTAGGTIASLERALERAEDAWRDETEVRDRERPKERNPIIVSMISELAWLKARIAVGQGDAEILKPFLADLERDRNLFDGTYTVKVAQELGRSPALAAQAGRVWRALIEHDKKALEADRDGAVAYAARLAGQVLEGGPHIGKEKLFSEIVDAILAAHRRHRGREHAGDDFFYWPLELKTLTELLALASTPGLAGTRAALLSEIERTLVSFEPINPERPPTDWPKNLYALGSALVAP